MSRFKTMFPQRFEMLAVSKTLKTTGCIRNCYVLQYCDSCIIDVERVDLYNNPWMKETKRIEFPENAFKKPRAINCQRICLENLTKTQAFKNDQGFYQLIFGWWTRSYSHLSSSRSRTWSLPPREPTTSRASSGTWISTRRLSPRLLSPRPRSPRAEASRDWSEAPANVDLVRNTQNTYIMFGLWSLSTNSMLLGNVQSR